MSSGLFVTGEQFEITLKYMVVKLKSGISAVRVFNENKEKDKELMEKYKDKIQELTTVWVQPNWKVSNDMARRCMVLDPFTGTRHIDTPTYRGMILETCLKAWDVVNEEGVKVPCDKANIEKLAPDIAFSLAEEFLTKTVMSDEDMGN